MKVIHYIFVLCGERLGANYRERDVVLEPTTLVLYVFGCTYECSSFDMSFLIRVAIARNWIEYL